jgi:hypothetical protein
MTEIERIATVLTQLARSTMISIDEPAQAWGSCTQCGAPLITLRCDYCRTWQGDKERGE